MWESPINAIYEAQQNALEGAMLSAVMRVGIDVNKEELIKALAYDRQQYEKGYADAKAEIVRCKDCVNWDTSWSVRANGHHYCAVMDTTTDGCDYCSNGERRTDGR